MPRYIRKINISRSPRFKNLKCDHSTRLNIHWIWWSMEWSPVALGGNSRIINLENNILWSLWSKLWKMKFSTKSNILHYEIRFEGWKIIRLVFNGIFDKINLRIPLMKGKMARKINLSRDNSRFRSKLIIIFIH